MVTIVSVSHTIHLTLVLSCVREENGLSISDLPFVFDDLSGVLLGQPPAAPLCQYGGSAEESPRITQNL